jgi:hypothetical protein
VPMFATTARFRRDYKTLAPGQCARFEKIVREEFVPDVDANQWRSGLRIKRVQGVPKVFEVTSAPDDGPPGSSGHRSGTVCGA